MYAVEPLTRPGDVLSRQLADWVERAKDGNVDAFEHIVKNMQGQIRSFTRGFLRDSGLGDDAAQETFLRIWKGLARYTESGSFQAWCFKLARNTCIEFSRKVKRLPIPVDRLPEELRNQIEDSEQVRFLREAIGTLDEPYRSTLLLRLTGLSYEEIAAATSSPIGTVRSRLSAAKRRLMEETSPLPDGGEGNE